MTFDVINDTPAGQPGSGAFGFMIIGTYDRGGSTSLQDWLKTNLPADSGALKPITWANSAQAGTDSNGHRFALTPHHVVEVDVRGDAIAADMWQRLDSWKFTS